MGLFLLGTTLFVLLTKNVRYCTCGACVQWEGKEICDKGPNYWIFESPEDAKLEAKNALCYNIHNAPIGEYFRLDDNKFRFSCRSKVKRELPQFFYVH